MAELTTNINYLQPTAFKLVIDRLNYPNLEFFAQTVSHPGITMSAAEQPYKRANIYLGGDKLTFDELTATILVDEDLKSYIEMYNWMERLVEQNNQSASVREVGGLPTMSDITLSILSSHNNVNKRFVYTDCVPTSLGNISFESTVSDVQYLTFQVSFRFSYFKIV